MKLTAIKSPPKPNEHLINGIKDLLEFAKSGKLRTFVAVTKDEQGQMQHIICTDLKDNLYETIGCLQCLLTRMTVAATSNAEFDECDPDSA